MKLAARDWFRRPSQMVVVEPRVPQESFPVHDHEFGEIVIVTSGHGWHVWNDEPQFITGGEVFYIRPQDRHSFEQVTDLHLTNFLYRPSERLLGHDRVQHLFDCPEGANRWQLTDDTLRELEPLIAQLAREARSDDPLSDAMAESLFVQLGVLLWRRRIPIDCEHLPTRSRFGHVLAYLRHHCTADLNIEEVAHRSGYSLRTFTRAFREVTGTTPYNYVVQLRIGHAKRAIRTTSESITAIAFASGFHDSNYFSSCFSRLTGVSPSEYRRMVQAEQGGAPISEETRPEARRRPAARGRSSSRAAG